MISGAKTWREVRALLAAVLLAAALPAAAFDLPELMGRLARHTSGEARFSEQRFVKGLDEPLQASGTLTFTAPDRFERRTLKPSAESMKVEGNTVTLSRGGRSRTLALDATPEAAAAVEAVRGTLTGDVAALQRHFRTTLAGDAERWTLTLQPLPAQAAGAVRTVRITGLRDEVRVVETELQDGDRTVMTIDPTPAGAAPAASGAR